jgi:hypothetical protein
MNKFYVYGLFVGDDPIPRYIGMGSGYRMNMHIRNAARELAKNISPSKNLGILHAIGCGLSVVPKKIICGLTREEAYENERRLIDEIGRADKLKGPLWNRSDGGGGAHNFSEQTRAKLSRKAKAQFASPEARRVLSERMTRRLLSGELVPNRIGGGGGVGNTLPRTENNCFKKGNTINVGRKRSEETRKRMSEAALRRWKG